MKILQGNEARQRIKKGIDKCVDVVKVSMGGQGKNVLIYNGVSTEIINDGVSIAREVNVKDEIEQAGIQLAKQCANQTDEDCGDGTTTTLVLLQSILDKIITDIPTGNPREIRENLFKEAEELLAEIPVKQIESMDDVYNLALTSSLDEKVAGLIKGIYSELGEDAQISIEETSRDVLEAEITKGMRFESKKADKLSEEKQIIEDCSVLVLDNVETIDEIGEAVKKASGNGENNLLVIANSFSRPVLVSIMATRTFNIIPIEYKMFTPLEDVKEYAGDKVKKAIITQDSVTLIEGNGDATGKIKALEDKLAVEESTYEKENLEKRIAQLKGKIAIIRVGKNTDVARTEAVKKVEDALGAVKGAYELGYCKGGGMALIDAMVSLNLSWFRGDIYAKDGKIETNTNPRKKIVNNFYGAPYRQICENAGVEKIEVGDNVIDSYKTVKYSLLNALSTATSILTAEAALIEEKEND